MCCFVFFGVDVGALGTPLPTTVLKSNKKKKEKSIFFSNYRYLFHFIGAPGYAWIGKKKLVITYVV